MRCDQAAITITGPVDITSAGLFYWNLLPSSHTTTRYYVPFFTITDECTEPQRIDNPLLFNHFYMNKKLVACLLLFCYTDASYVKPHERNATMHDYTVLKSSREELLKKAGYAEPHILFKLAIEKNSQPAEMGSKQNEHDPFAA